MSFNSTSFLVFLLIALLIYYIPKFERIQIVILITAGLVFFVCIGLYSFFFLLGSIVVNTSFRFFFCQNNISYFSRRLLFAISISINIITLFFLKYLGELIPLFASEKNNPLLSKIVLPLGISFYTFQAISMLVDSYKGNLPQDGIIKNSVLYLSFFPNAVSGPLISNSEFSASISHKRISDIQWDKVAKYLIVGYFLKMCIADNIQNQTIYMQYPYYLQYSPIQLIIMMFAYSGQIFADFAGYSLIAQGVALLFGYKLPDNFNYPYISKSIGDFWRRWHMSLSTWLKKYVYIPLGGNRKGKARTLFNLFVVMLICGFWHGSDWKYPLWGAIYGIILVVERMINPDDKKYRGLRSIIRIGLVFFVVSWLWLFFKLESVSDIFSYSKAMILNWKIWKSLDADCCVLSILYCIPIAVYHLIFCFRNKLENLKVWPYLRYSIYAGMVLMILMNRGTANAFVYFQF